MATAPVPLHPFSVMRCPVEEEETYTSRTRIRLVSSFIIANCCIDHVKLSQGYFMNASHHAQSHASEPNRRFVRLETEKHGV